MRIEEIRGDGARRRQSSRGFCSDGEDREGGRRWREEVDEADQERFAGFRCLEIRGVCYRCLTEGPDPCQAVSPKPPICFLNPRLLDHCGSSTHNMSRCRNLHYILHLLPTQVVVHMWCFFHACLVDDDAQDNKARKAVVGARIKFERHFELSVSDTSGPSSHVSCFGRKLNQNMTEAEREARRIRRVLANRESARQTIRRRQALREELIKKVADLSQENKNMKMEKELVTKEYLSLKDRNKELKEQMAKAIKYEVEVGTEITLMSHVEKSTSPSTELSLVAPSGPSGTVCAPWSSVPSDAVACYEEGGSSRTGASKAHFFASPCAWFYPFLHQTSESYLSCCQESSNTGVNFLGNQHGFRHCPEAGDNLERASLHVGNKTNIRWTETGAIEEEKNAGINLEEMPVGFDGHDTILGHDPAGVLIRSHDVENQDSDVKSEEETGNNVDRMTDQLGTIVAEKSQGAFIPPFKKLVDPSASAAARRRRKELTKLKMKCLHGRQIRLHS